MDRSAFHRLHRTAMRYMVEFEKCVIEGVRVDEAHNFALFMCNSGVCEILSDNPETNANLAVWQPYDGKELWRRAEQLRLLCCEYYSRKTSKSPGTARGVPASELTKLNEKVDVLVSVVAALAENKKRKLKNAKGPKLIVLPTSAAR